MTTVIINPGTGPVDGATLDHAHTNMIQLLKDAGCPDAKLRRDVEEAEDDGRFAFLVTCPPDEDHPRDWEVSVLMPGIPLEDVRWLDKPGQNIWRFPRLYVDGSSWVWKFAVSQLRECTSPNEGGASE